MDFWWFSSSSNEIRAELCGIFLPFQGYENVSWNIFQIFLQHDAVDAKVMQVRNYF